MEVQTGSSKSAELHLRLNKVHFKDFDFGFAVGENGIILRTTSGGEPVTLVEDENQSPSFI